MFGILNLRKPSGITSRDAVNQVQRIVRPVKVGHAGTLDPLADGVLLVMLGGATRLTEYLQRLPKQYHATFLLGRRSDTEDTQGEVILLPTDDPPSMEQLRQVLPRFRGPILQRPPAFSALKVAGRRAYQLARAGQPVALAPRKVQIDELQIEQYDYPQLVLRIVCGSGTYVRSLGRDLADALGTGAVMSALTRTAIGPWKVEQAVDPEQLDRTTLSEHLQSPLMGLPDLQRVMLHTQQRQAVQRGQSVSLPDRTEDELAATDEAGRLLAILVRRDLPGTYGPRRNFSDCHGPPTD